MREALRRETDISVVTFDFDLTLAIRHAYASLHLGRYRTLQEFLSRSGHVFDDFVLRYFGPAKRIAMIRTMFDTWLPVKTAVDFRSQRRVHVRICPSHTG